MTALTIRDIKRAVSTALKKEYPKHKVYGEDTKEGYEKPSFFVYVTQTFIESTANAVHKNVEIEIDYIQNTPNEDEGVDFFERMEKLFGQKLAVGDRQLNTLNHYADQLTDNMYVPTFAFDVEFWTKINKKQENVALMQELILKQEDR